MSVVSGVTLQVSCVEDDEFDFLFGISSWLTDRGFGKLTAVHDQFGGSKHPQVYVFGGGYNYFPEDEFAEMILALPWDNPENVVLLITPEEGATRVFRPTS